jgi:histone-lysine N-methyltransferase SETD3
MLCRGLPLQESFPLRIDSLPGGLLPYLAFLLAQPSNPDEVEELAGWLFDKGELPVLDGQDLKLLALQGLANRCQAALQGMR